MSDSNANLKSLSPDMYDRLTGLERRFADVAYARWVARAGLRERRERDPSQGTNIRRSYRDAALQVIRVGSLIWVGGIALTTISKGRRGILVVGVLLLAVGAGVVGFGYFRIWQVNRYARHHGIERKRRR